MQPLTVHLRSQSISVFGSVCGWNSQLQPVAKQVQRVMQKSYSACCWEFPLTKPFSLCCFTAHLRLDMLVNNSDSLLGAKRASCGQLVLSK